MNHRICEAITLIALPVMLYFLLGADAGAQQLEKLNYIDFNSSSVPVDINKAILISIKNHIFVEINSFGHRFRIIAKLLDSEQENQIYFGRIYLKHNSEVIGYVKRNRFIGLIKVDGIAYNIETVPRTDPNYFDQNGKVVMYREDTIPFNAISDPVLIPQSMYRKRKGLKWRRGSKQRLFAQTITELPKNKVCALDLYADSSFTRNFGTMGAIAEMFIMVREANALFSRIDFDGDGLPDRIGVSAVKWTVSDTSDETYIETNGQKLLRKFQRRLTDHCIQVLFTHQNLKYEEQGITGLANLKGVCHKQSIINGYLQSPNSLLVSSLSNHKLVNRVQRIIDLTHEIGHSFGARHDNEDFESKPLCNPNADNGGAFIMSTIHETPTYQVSDLRNKKRFSFCSKHEMKKVLSDSETNHCFKWRPKSKCGDLEVNTGEECDAGSPEISQFADPCCEPTGTALQCKIKRGIECHPRDGSCCDVKACKFYHWKTFPHKCRIECWEPAFCLEKSAKCPVREPLTAGSICWNCSSDDCVCNQNGFCENRIIRIKTTPQPPPSPTIPSRSSIKTFKKVVFGLLFVVIFLALSIFCWFSGLFDNTFDYLRQQIYNLRRNRIRNRLLDEPIGDYEDSDTSDHEHSL